MNIRPWHIVVFVLALLVFAIARAPAAFFAPQRPGVFTYERALGTVWRARLEKVRLGPYETSSLSWRLSLLDLLQGKARAPLDFERGSIEGRVMLLANMHNDRRLYAPNLTLIGFPLTENLRAPGETTLSDIDIFFDNGVCLFAHGQAQSDVLARAGEAIGWPGPPLTGDAACEGEDARILLIGTSAAGERVSARLTLRGDGGAEWRLIVQSVTPETELALTAAGFQRGADGFEISKDGRWLPF